MELTLKRLLEQAKFTTARKGYDQAEVDELLDRAVKMATKVEARLTQAIDEAKQADGSAGPFGSDLEAEVERRVAERLELERAAPAIDAPTGPTEEETAEEVRRTIVLAQRTADAAVREAREEADALLAEARERATVLAAAAEDDAFRQREAVAAEVERERAEARERLAAEIRALEGAREALRSDVTVLEAHVEEQRVQVRSTVVELQRLLDDPAGFRLAPVPVLLDPELPAVESPAVDVDGSVDLDEGAPVDPVAEPSASASDAGDLDPHATPDAAPDATEAEPEGSGPAGEEPEAAAPAPEEERFGEELSEPGIEPQDEAANQALPLPLPLPLTIDEVDHEAPGVQDPVESGPPTAPVPMIDVALPPSSPAPTDPAGDDAFLAELRKAMEDEEPLGPRDPGGEVSGGAFYEDERRGWRFGKRR